MTAPLLDENQELTSHGERVLTSCNFALDGDLGWSELVDQWAGLLPEERQQIVVNAGLNPMMANRPLKEVIDTARKAAPWRYDAPQQVTVVHPIIQEIRRFDAKHHVHRRAKKRLDEKCLTEGLTEEEKENIAEFEAHARGEWTRRAKQDFLEAYNLEEDEVRFVNDVRGPIAYYNPKVELDKDIEEYLASDEFQAIEEESRLIRKITALDPRSPDFRAERERLFAELQEVGKRGKDWLAETEGELEEE